MVLQEKFIRFASILLILTCCAAVRVSAQSETKCFQNDALKGTQIVNFEISGEQLAGTFEHENGESELARKYKFSGTVAGNTLRVKFENGELPDVAPSEIRNLNWTIGRKTSGEILQIEFYGKNYETGKYADYLAEFQQCAPNYDALLQAAKTIRFARGKSAATESLKFRDLSERKVFALNARRGQTLTIDAPGCKISVYLPGGGLYEFVKWEGADGEKTFTVSTIDRAAVKTLPLAGNYLIVLQKMAENAAPQSATLSLTK